MCKKLAILSLLMFLSDVLQSLSILTKSVLLNALNFMAPFYGWYSTTPRLEQLRGGSLLFITMFPEIPGTYFIDLGEMKG